MHRPSPSPEPDDATALADPAGAAGDAPGLPSISVVMPVLNEERHLAEAVAAVLAQDYAGPDRGRPRARPEPRPHRRDRRAATPADPRVRTVPNPTGRTPAALNAAIAASSHATSSCGSTGTACSTATTSRTAVRLLEETGAANVGGLMDAEGVTAFERAVAAAMTSPLGVGRARFHTGGEAGPADTVYLGVFRREWLDQAGRLRRRASSAPRTGS